jgi:hypothetical protein
VSQAQLASQVLKESKALQVLKVNRDRKVFKDHQALLAPRESREFKELQVRLGHKEFREFLEQRESPEQQDRKVLKA